MISLGYGFPWDTEAIKLYYQFVREMSSERAFRKVIEDRREKGFFREVFVDVSDFSRHVSVVGQSGSGKTVLYKNLLRHLAYESIPVFVIDPKPDFTLEATLRRLSEETGRPFLLFDPLLVNNEGVSYNPISRYFRSYEIAERISECFPGLTSDAAMAYVVFAKTFLLNITTAMLALGERPSLTSLLSYTSMEQLKSLLARSRQGRVDMATISQLEYYVSMSENNFYRMMSNVQNTLTMLAKFPLCPDGEEGVLRLDSAFEQKAIVYLKLSSLMLGKNVESIGKLFLSDFLSFLGYLLVVERVQDSFLLVDEASMFVFPRVAELLKMGRQAKVKSIWAMQDYADLEEGLRSVMIQNTALKFFFKVVHPDLLKIVSDVLHQTYVPWESVNVSLGGSSSVSRQFKEVPRVDSSIFPTLRPGEFFMSLSNFSGFDGGSVDDLYYVQGHFVD